MGFRGFALPGVIGGTLLVASSVVICDSGDGGAIYRRLGVQGSIAVLTFAGGATAGMIGLLAQRRITRRLSDELRKIATDLTPSRLDRVPGPLSQVVDATNELIDSVESAVNKAAVSVKELEIQLKVATAERRHAEAIIYSISDAVVVTDPFDEVVLANESAARTFGFDLQGADRKPVDQVLTDPKMIELIREMRQSDSRNGRRIVEHNVRTSVGERVFKVTLSNVGGPDAGAPSGRSDHRSGVVAVLHDMTREKEVAEMKNDFVSNVSHELRTPLASIKAYVEMLVDGEAEDERTRGEFYDIIQTEANRLGRLIDNILNISRIESGLVKISRTPQSLAVILREAMDVIAPQAGAKKIAVVDKLAPIHHQANVDKDMIYQAVLNLLSNAVKYTPEGGTVTVENVVDEDKKLIVTRVRDTGVGIPPKDLPFVFDKFYRAESNNHMAKGTGLGLSLVKHIVETVHKGRMFVESQAGTGSTFGFELPLSE